MPDIIDPAAMQRRFLSPLGTHRLLKAHIRTGSPVGRAQKQPEERNIGPQTSTSMTCRLWNAAQPHRLPQASKLLELTRPALRVRDQPPGWRSDLSCPSKAHDPLLSQSRRRKSTSLSLFRFLWGFRDLRRAKRPIWAHWRPPTSHTSQCSRISGYRLLSTMSNPLA